MADQQNSTIRGVKIESLNWATAYEGTREDLIAAGIGLHVDLLPDGTKRDKRGRCIRRCEGQINGRKVTTTWMRERGKYAVYVHRTPDEEKRLLAAEEARDLQNGGAKRMAQKEFDYGAGFLIRAFNMTDDPDRPYRFSEEAKAKVKEHLQKVMWWFENGGFEPRFGAIASGDSEFQRFMSRLPKGANKK